jgi:hypothetical protein
MIALKADCLLFELENGESVPFSPEMLSVEFVGDTPTLIDSEFVRNAADAVVYYFKHELERQTVTMNEFARALAKVLRGFSPELNKAGAAQSRNAEVIESDLGQLMFQGAREGELFFFPRLREELRAQLRLEPRELHFRGLRDCVKALAGAQRWTPRCAELRDQIVEFLRNCLTAEARTGECAVLVK